MVADWTARNVARLAAMNGGDVEEPMDELAAFILARVEEDEVVWVGADRGRELTVERLRVESEVKRRLVSHVQGIDWTYEPAGDQDYMWKILELLALPWREHPDFRSSWSI